MTAMQNSNSEACNLANQIANRYGRLALTRAAGEAAAAERKGDHAQRALWTSVVSYLRQAIQQDAHAVAAV